MTLAAMIRSLRSMCLHSFIHRHLTRLLSDEDEAVKKTTEFCLQEANLPAMGKRLQVHSASGSDKCYDAKQARVTGSAWAQGAVPLTSGLFEAFDPSGGVGVAWEPWPGPGG